MKRVPSVAAVLLVLLVALLAAPSGASGQVPTRDSVTGTVTGGPGADPLTWNINVSSGPSGENPTGSIEATSPFGSIPLQVTCLQVTANRAVIGGREIIGASTIQVYLIVIDEPGDLQDRLLDSVFINEPLAPATCAGYEASLPVGAFPPPVASGSVVVTDAQPFPTSKDQCKNGGWRNFPGFKNEGDCVSFVATHGKH